MAPPKLPADRRTIHRSVSLRPTEWAMLVMMGNLRQPRVSRSGMVAEAVREYLARRVGPTPVAERDEVVA